MYKEVWQTFLVSPQIEIVTISLAWYPTSFDADTKNVSNRCIIKSNPSLSRKNESKKKQEWKYLFQAD